MYDRPLPVELLVGDFSKFVEVESEFYAGVDVGLRFVGELWVRERVGYFLGHYGSLMLN